MNQFFIKNYLDSLRTLIFKMTTGSKTATYWNAQSVSYLPRTLGDTFIIYVFQIAMIPNFRWNIFLEISMKKKIIVVIVPRAGHAHLMNLDFHMYGWQK